MVFCEICTYVLEDLSDKRTKNWPLMDSVSPIILILVTYLFIVKIAGPRYMENRKPYDLKRIIQCYNLFQVFSCIILIYGVVTNGWIQKFTLGCEPIDYSDDPMAIRLAGMFWWTMMLKMAELIETIFFVLRKKYNQVSNLHLYHHTSTLFITWCGVKYIAGGMASFPIILNSFIHIVMYMYYFLATFGPEWQTTLNKWKNKLTIMQMIQFCIIVAHALQVFRPGCDAPSLAAFLFIPNILLVFYMFYDFYRKNYLTKKNK